MMSQEIELILGSGRVAQINSQSIVVLHMRYFLFFFFLYLYLIATSNAANDSYCHSIRNSDQKNFCLALAKNQDSYCYSIREPDSKNLCLAQTKNQKSYCYSIKTSDIKNHCIAILK